MTEEHANEQLDSQPRSEPSQERPDWRELREEERETRRAERGTSPTAWIGGAVMILIGVVFLLQNMGNWSLGNWWALFILIPAVVAFVNAWNIYKNNGYRFSSGIGGSILGGLMMLLVACIFLFDMDWGKVWPLFLIVAGLGALLIGVLPKD
jgi:cation transport ATPase